MDVPRRLALRVGAFAAIAAAVGFLVVLVLGSEGMFLASKRSYRVAYPDVAGLREGAVVRLGGHAVGDVHDIHFGFGPDQHQALVVTIRVREEFAGRVRVDSLARISSQGLLGDKLIELTLGSPAAPPVEENGWIIGEPPADAARLMVAATGAAEHARSILARLDEASANLDTGRTVAELEGALGAVRRIAERVETGPGMAHDLIYDEGLARETGRAVAAFQRAAAQGEKTMASARRSADRLAEITGAVDPAKVRQAADDLTGMVADLRAGRGTLGGLIADPTLYEETKRILVNIRRNRVLKAVSRLVISESMPDELMDAAPVTVTPRHAPTPAAAAESGSAGRISPPAAPAVKAQSRGTRTR